MWWIYWWNSDSVWRKHVCLLNLGVLFLLVFTESFRPHWLTCFLCDILSKLEELFLKWMPHSKCINVLYLYWLKYYSSFLDVGISVWFCSFAPLIVTDSLGVMGHDCVIQNMFIFFVLLTVTYLLSAELNGSMIAVRYKFSRWHSFLKLVVVLSNLPLAAI